MRGVINPAPPKPITKEDLERWKNLSGTEKLIMKRDRRKEWDAYIEAQRKQEEKAYRRSCDEEMVAPQRWAEAKGWIPWKEEWAAEFSAVRASYKELGDIALNLVAYAIKGMWMFDGAEVYKSYYDRNHKQTPKSERQEEIELAAAKVRYKINRVMVGYMDTGKVDPGVKPIFCWAQIDALKQIRDAGVRGHIFLACCGEAFGREDMVRKALSADTRLQGLFEQIIKDARTPRPEKWEDWTGKWTPWDEDIPAPKDLTWNGEEDIELDDDN